MSSHSVVTVSLGLTSLNSLRPKFAMALATDPTFCAPWGLQSTTTMFENPSLSSSSSRASAARSAPPSREVAFAPDKAVRAPPLRLWWRRGDSSSARDRRRRRRRSITRRLRGDRAGGTTTTTDDDPRRDSASAPAAMRLILAPSSDCTFWHHPKLDGAPRFGGRENQLHRSPARWYLGHPDDNVKRLDPWAHPWDLSFETRDAYLS